LRFGDSAGALNKSTRENTAIIIANAIEILCGVDPFPRAGAKRIRDGFRASYGDGMFGHCEYSPNELVGSIMRKR
jgi:hypothetical protein